MASWPRRITSFWLLSAAALLTLPAWAEDATPEPSAAPKESPPEAPAESQAAADPWCTVGFETLAGDICFAPGSANKTGRRTLVIFLHGLVDEGKGWQHNQQKGFLLAAKRHGFALLAPRGQNGIGPKRRSDQIGWPTAAQAQKDSEEGIIASWKAAQKVIEDRDQKPFDEVFVMGFSNGAYYAASLALRGKLEVDGYAVFAGGSAANGMERLAKSTKNRKPIFVGITSKDATAKDAKGLAKALKTLGWPHQSVSKKVGHVVTDSQLESAVVFLRERAAKPAAEPTKKAATKVKPKPKKPRGKSSPHD